jgi:hypothetical protein
MKSLLRHAIPLSVAALVGLFAVASPAVAQPGRGGGWCPPGQAKKGRCGNDVSRSQNGDWCWDRNRDGRCDDVYATRRGDGDEDDGVYHQRGSVYDRNPIYDRNGNVIRDRGVYDRNGSQVARDRNGNVIYDRNGNPVYENQGKAEVRSKIGGLIDRARAESRGRR